MNVVDAYRLMKTNGPRGKSEADVVLAKGLFMSPDIVAVDTAATSFSIRWKRCLWRWLDIWLKERSLKSYDGHQSLESEED